MVAFQRGAVLRSRIRGSGRGARRARRGLCPQTPAQPLGGIWRDRFQTRSHEGEAPLLEHGSGGGHHVLDLTVATPELLSEHKRVEREATRDERQPVALTSGAGRLLEDLEQGGAIGTPHCPGYQLPAPQVEHWRI